MVFTRFSGRTDSLTYGRTDLNTVCLRHRFFQWWQMHKNQAMSTNNNP